MNRVGDAQSQSHVYLWQLLQHLTCDLVGCLDENGLCVWSSAVTSLWMFLLSLGLRLITCDGLSMLQVVNHKTSFSILEHLFHNLACILLLADFAGDWGHSVSISWIVFSSRYRSGESRFRPLSRTACISYLDHIESWTRSHEKWSPAVFSKQLSTFAEPIGLTIF